MTTAERELDCNTNYDWTGIDYKKVEKMQNFYLGQDTLALQTWGTEGQEGIYPRMFKNLIAANHPEFSSMRQQKLPLRGLNKVEQPPMASNMGGLPEQAPGGRVNLHFVRRNKGTGTPPAADGDQRRPLNIDLNVKAPEQD